MGTNNVRTTFHHYEDCDPYTGCLGHTLHASYQRTSDSFSYWVDEGEREYMDLGQMNALRELIEALRGPVVAVDHDPSTDNVEYYS